MTTIDMNALAKEMNASVANAAGSIVTSEPATESPYFFIGAKGELIDPLASPKTPDWVRAHAMAIPTDETGNFAHPYGLKVALDLLTNVKAGDTRTTLAKIFPHGSVRRQDGTFRTATVSAQTVEHSLVMVIPGFDASKPLSGIETATFVPMAKVAKKVRGQERYTVNAHHMACRVKANTENGEVKSFTIMAGCEIAIRQTGGGLKDSVWTDSSTSIRVSSLSNLAGQAKQLVSAIARLAWVNAYRQTLEAGVSADGDTYHTALVRLSTNYFGMPYGAADKAGELRADGETPVITPRIHNRLVGLDDPAGRAKDLPASYVWQGFSGVFA